MKKYILGIDFGHGETAAWVVPIDGQGNDKVKNKDGESIKLLNTNAVVNRMIDSVIYQDRNGNYSLLPTGNIITGMKGKISEAKKLTAYKAFIFSIVERVLNLNSDILHKEDGEWNFYLCIACPTKWGHEDRQDYLKFFNIALQPLNIEITWIINESDAAYFTHHDASKNVLVIDYGSSSIDYTLISKSKKISNDEWSNTQLGASLIETAYYSKIVKQKDFKKCLLKTVNACQDTGHEYMADEVKIQNELIYRCRKYKESAFTNCLYPEMPLEYFNIASIVGIRIPNGTPFEGLEFNFSGNLGDIIGPVDEKTKVLTKGCYIWCVRESLRELKEHIQNETDCEQIDSIILSGGASIMSWLKPIIQEIFGDFINIEDNVVTDTTPSFVVAKGIALYARTQMNALQKLRDRITTIPFKYIYEREYIKARKEAMLEITTNEAKRIIEPLDRPDGFRIRDEYFKIIQNIDYNNPDFCQLVEQNLVHAINTEVKDMVYNIINEEFNYCIDKSDIFVCINPIVGRLEDSCFLPGGSIYENITKGIASTRFRFTWEDPREKEDVKRIVDKTNSVFKSFISNDFVLKIIDIEERVESLKKEILSQIDKIFYDNQLFKTTFKR